MFSLLAKSSLFLKIYLEQVVVAAEREVSPPTSQDNPAPVDHAQGMFAIGPTGEHPWVLWFELFNVDTN